MTRISTSHYWFSRRTLLTSALLFTVSACGAQDETVDTAHEQALTPSVALTLPKPTGKYPVGVHSSFVLDPTRREEGGQPRALPMTVWYPAIQTPGTSVAPYLSARIQAEFEAWAGAPSHTFDIDTHTRLEARPREHVRGVLLATGGWQMPIAFYTALTSELASQGFVVVGFDHPHETMVVEQPEGDIIAGTLSSAEGFPERMLDVGVVLEHLPELVPHWRRDLPVGIFGHSLGGSAALESLRLYPVLAAAANLDGTPRGGVVESGLSKPFAVMLSTIRIVDHLDDGMDVFLAKSSGLRRLKQLNDVYHTGLSDFVTLNPQIATKNPELYLTLEANLRTDVVSVEVGEASIVTQRRFVREFFEKFLACER